MFLFDGDRLTELMNRLNAALSPSSLLYMSLSFEFGQAFCHPQAALRANPSRLTVFSDLSFQHRSTESAQLPSKLRCKIGHVRGKTNVEGNFCACDWLPSTVELRAVLRVAGYLKQGAGVMERAWNEIHHIK